MDRYNGRIVVLTLAIAVGTDGAKSAAAQAPAASEQARACYVPGSGTIYRVKTAKAPSGCVAADHIEFTLGEASVAQAAKKPGGTTSGVDHGSLAGLLDDDHPQYVPVDGVRNATNGFAITGTLGVGTIPASGSGTRLMWYPGKAAFRVGQATGDNWDNANVGSGSFASGRFTKASGHASVAMGAFSRALGEFSTAIGGSSSASGDAAIALGDRTEASGTNAVAIGSLARASETASMALGLGSVASGTYSMAIGHNGNTNGQAGAIVLSARMPTVTEEIKAVAPSQFVARANRFWFGNNTNVTALPGQLIATSTGAHLTTGGTWVNSSDVNRKEHFESVSGEDVLERLATLSIQSWNYRDEDSTVRHIGPTAQDFRSAYGLGASETTIATVDADGVALAAAQALERRTREQAREIDTLRERIREQAAALDELRAALRASPRQDR